jgi:hypothetical protein
MVSYPPASRPPTGRECIEPMEPPGSCQSCRQAVNEGRLTYRRGQDVVKNEALLQCDICERFACADCLRVYDIYSGYDFLCHECARELQDARLRGPGH